MDNAKSAVLLLEDGTSFNGLSIGATGTTVGEICFNTGMTGYQEIFTDPSYFGQILVTATTHIGNYGVSELDQESDSVKIAGLVCKKFSQVFSRPSAFDSLQNYFLTHNLVGISEIDTRKLIRHIRKVGAMNAIISSEEFDVDKLKAKLEQAPNMAGLKLSNFVSTKQAYEVKADNPLFRVALVDYGVKTNIIRCLTDRGCSVTVFPHSVSTEEVLASKPDGIMLSNGPGDPKAMDVEVKVVQELCNAGIPVFGICLGHQLIALSQGLNTEKMHHGHRGINHPVINTETRKCEITSQNHGFVVSDIDIEKQPNIQITHRHLNDNTIAGIKVLNKPVFSVQYHPESNPGPNDSRYLFDNFINLIQNFKS
ncbi:MAG: glutamine-hydrolyzing carbamoyl-phosphate synthase small subunit [Luteibaculaceae bacterium]